jgi:hypothetical protein
VAAIGRSAVSQPVERPVATRATTAAATGNAAAFAAADPASFTAPTGPSPLAPPSSPLAPAPSTPATPAPTVPFQDGGAHGTNHVPAFAVLALLAALLLGAGRFERSLAAPWRPLTATLLLERPG